MRNIAFTMAQNDLVGLNLWCRYYSKHFDKLLVLFFNLKEKYLPKIKRMGKKYNMDYEVVNEYQGHNVSDPQISLGLIRDKQSYLLGEYDWVLFCNIDEILIPKKEYRTLKNLMKIKLNSSPVLICEGYELIQIKNEKPIDYTKPYFKQRKYWIKNINYNKILLSRIPLIWNAGLHQIEGITNEDSKSFKNTELYLIHLKHADLDAKKRDLGPFTSNLDPNIMEHWRKFKKRVPDYIKKAL